VCKSAAPFEDISIILSTLTKRMWEKKKYMRKKWSRLIKEGEELEPLTYAQYDE
jgi:hypothetical protein